jgi:hypothetical protein
VLKNVREEFGIMEKDEWMVEMASWATVIVIVAIIIFGILFI